MFGTDSFSLILRAFARLPKLRKEAIDIVASAPQLLERTERLIALDADQGLQDKADALYVALLYVLEEIISWYPHIGSTYEMLIKTATYAIEAMSRV